MQNSRLPHAFTRKTRLLDGLGAALQVYKTAPVILKAVFRKDGSKHAPDDVGLLLAELLERRAHALAADAGFFKAAKGLI